MSRREVEVVHRPRQAAELRTQRPPERRLERRESFERVQVVLHEQLQQLATLFGGHRQLVH